MGGFFELVIAFWARRSRAAPIRFEPLMHAAAWLMNAKFTNFLLWFQIAFENRTIFGLHYCRSQKTGKDRKLTVKRFRFTIKDCILVANNSWS